MEINNLILDEIIVNALKEDVGTGDITSNAIVPAQAMARGFFLVKEDGVIAGLAVAERVFQLIDQRVTFQAHKKDGDTVKNGEIVATVNGPARVLLAGERLSLNLLQRLSGIASQTRQTVESIGDSKAVLVDTRKTTPGLRMLEKYAVRVGGAQNHRFGLYDGVLIKDNHIKMAGGIREAVSLARKNAPHTVKIEVEVETLAGVNEALEANADIIMLDNMAPDMVKDAVELIQGKALVEVSGGIDLQKAKLLAGLGVDLISMGSLTHSVRALDISLDLGEIKKVK